jgi:hypothetical protein
MMPSITQQIVYDDIATVDTARRRRTVQATERFLRLLQAGAAD